MGWSWKIGRLAGIAVYVHATFLLLLGWIAWLQWTQQHSWVAVGGGIAYILALFACVVLHELGHALTAARYGIPTHDITLLPIGGLARLERMPEEPREELRVALAGPAVNVVIAAALFAWLRLSGDWQPLDQLGFVSGGLVERIMLANLLLVGFNLLPAFPMDGGRALRALLALRLDYARATSWAAAIGQGMAVLFVFVGVFWNPFLVFIGLFVWIGAASESSSAQMKSALAGVPVRRAMVTQFRTLAPWSTLEDAAELIRSSAQHDFPVVADGRLQGLLTRDDVLAGIESGDRNAPVAGRMRPACPSAHASQMLEGVLASLQERGCQTIPVVEGGTLVGLVTMEHVAQFLRVLAAERKSAPAHASRG